MKSGENFRLPASTGVLSTFPSNPAVAFSFGWMNPIRILEAWDASLRSVSRFGYSLARLRSITREAAFGNRWAGPFRYALHTLGNCADGPLAPASKRHRIEAKAEHVHTVLQGLAARLSRGR